MENKLEVTNLISPLINLFRLANAEFKHQFDIGISDYLQSQTEKYYFTNTFLHRNEKVKFQNIYHPLKAKYNLLKTDFIDLEEIFGNYNNITIVGSAGSGKSTLIKHIFLQTIKIAKKIPILIELRNLNEYNGDLEIMISEKVLKGKIKLSDETFKRTLESGSFLFLFDGYDEIFSNKKQEIIRQIELFVDSYSKNNFLITSRPGSGIEGFPRFHDFKICELENEDVINFINRLVSDSERKNRILETTSNPKNKILTQYLRNPLLLSMFIMAFENHPEIPSKKSSFYRNVFDTLYSKHDGITKNSFPREKITKFQRDDFEKILNVFCYLSLLDGKYSFTEEYISDKFKIVRKFTELDFNTQQLIYDLHTTISIIILDGMEYSFPHRSLQEYFTAQFISEMKIEDKSKVYENIVVIFESYSNDSSFNFWKLCFELDEIPFIKYFLLPKLKKIYEVLKEKKGSELLDTFIDLTDMKVFSIFHLKEKCFYNLYLPSTINTSILKFSNIIHMGDFNGIAYEFELKFELTDPFKKVIRNDSQSFIYHFPIGSIEKGILLEINFYSFLANIKKTLEEKIIFFENCIETKQNNLDELLNIITQKRPPF